MKSVPGVTISATTLAAPPEARQAYEKGEKAISRGKFAEAERELKKAIAQYPDFAAAWSMLGEVQRQQATFSFAKESYLHAIAADPQFVSPHYGLSIIAVHEKNWTNALKYTEQVLQLNPSLYPMTHMYNAAANYYLGKFDAAEDSARKFEKLDTDHQHPDSALLLSNILLAKHDYAGAADALQR